jgi:two-component system phosphate regulon sensor histidine kinase PhoR
LIEDLLRLARIEREAERSEVVLERMPVLSVLEAALETSRGMPGGAEAEIVLGCAEGLEANLNQELLEQAIVNLVSNAIRYGGGEIRVEGRSVGQRVEISVEDHGKGIPLEHQERLFERFYTVDKARSRRLGGTGLGLAIVKHIARAHGGDVTVSSESGHGARFTIRLPGLG